MAISPSTMLKDLSGSPWSALSSKSVSPGSDSDDARFRDAFTNEAPESATEERCQPLLPYDFHDTN